MMRKIPQQLSSKRGFLGILLGVLSILLLLNDTSTAQSWVNLSSKLAQIHGNSLTSDSTFKPSKDTPTPTETISGGPRIQFRPTGDDPHPSKTESGGVRDDALCLQDIKTPSSAEPRSSRIRAVVPSEIKYTASARPKFWITVPKTKAKKIILSIKTESGAYHSQTQHRVEQSPVLMGLTMSEEAPDLESGQVYHWSVLLVCGETPTPSDPGIALSITRINSFPPNTVSTVKEKAIWFSQNGIWHDAVSVLLDPPQNNANSAEIPQLWQALLQSANLDSIAQHYGPQQGNVVVP